MAEEYQEQQVEQQEQQQEEQVEETVSKNEYDELVNELEEVKSKLPKELTEDEKALQEKEQDLFNREVNATLKENGLEQFTDVIKVENNEELEQTVKSLNQIVNGIKTSVGYVPADHASDDEYSKFAKDNDTQGMINSKLSKLFG